MAQDEATKTGPDGAEAARPDASPELTKGEKPEPEPEAEPVRSAAVPVLTGGSSGGEQPPAAAPRSAAPAARRPLSDRIGREAVGIVVLVVLALICAGLIAAVVVKTRNDAAAAAREAAAYTPPPLDGSAAAEPSSSAAASRSPGPGRTASPSSSAAVTVAPAAVGSTVAIIGDGSVTTAASGVGAARRWPALLEDAVDGDLSTAASAGAGYTVAGTDGRTFDDAAASVPSDADFVVFVGGSADAQTSALQLATAATSAYSRAAQRAPDARIIVVAPLTTDGASTDQLSRLRSALRGSVRIAGARFADPQAADWGLGDPARPADLTARDERLVAQEVAALLTAD